MSEKPDLRNVYKLYSGMTGFAILAVVAGLWYANSNEEQISEEPAPVVEIQNEQGSSPQP